MRRQRSFKGFTLIEVMIVIAVIGILAAVAVSQLASYRRTAQDNAAKTALHQLAKAQEDYYVQNNTYTANRIGLFTNSGWTVESTITINILASSNLSWTATAIHKGSNRSWTYASARGGLLQ
ncbi:MAG: prepilin-type N-terminal cleavage/methylation domain-containing protein [Thermodesulfobacteriota bacterium]